MPTTSLLALVAPLLAGRSSGLDVPYTKHVLDNGLEVVVHEDHSDPVVSVFVYYHVGSGREEPGRSGFAHLFEHMLFQGSEHVGDDEHFKLVSEAGGTLNGSTTNDRTNYYETLPASQLELALWLESDRMGWFLPAITQAKLDNQRDVVKNERRQNYENRPYGQAAGAIATSLYPSDHPYSWLTIGSQEDLTAASLEDVKGFFARWYGPNNATLAIGGDVDTAQALALVEKWFASIPRGPAVDKPLPRRSPLRESKRVVIEDRVQLPQLELVWPGVEGWHADEAALDVLASILASNRSSLLERALTIDSDLASEVSARNSSDEVAGEFSITVRANPGVTLDSLEARVDALLAGLAERGVDPEQVARARTRYEASFVRRLETVQARTAMLCDHNTFTKDPGSWRRALDARLAVEADDVTRVLREHVIGKPRVALSVVPRGKPALAAAGSRPPEPWKPEAKPGPDRAKRPEAAPVPAFRAPAVWTDGLANGVPVTATTWRELPLSTLTVALPAGQIREEGGKLGLSALVAQMLEQGTRTYSAVELAERLDEIGASLRVSAGDDEIRVSVSSLDEHFDEALAVLREVLLEPRFASEDFERLKKERLVDLETRSDQIRVVAGDVYRRLLWGDSVLAMPSTGTPESVAKLSLDDVRAFWKRHGSAAGSRITYVGGLGKQDLARELDPLVKAWRSETVASPAPEPQPVRFEATRIYLVDKPGAAQSEIRIGHASVSSLDPRYYPLTVLNHALGGAFSSRINLNLRESKGYTYGARTSFEGGPRAGAFTASAAVKTDVTADAVREMMKELVAIRDGVTKEELGFSRLALRQGATRQFESTMALAGMLDEIARYGYPADYVERRLGQLEKLQPAELGALAKGAIDPARMAIVVVGDAERIGASLAGLGYGEVVVLDARGERVGER